MGDAGAPGMRVVLDTSALVGAAPDLPEAEFAVASLCYAELQHGVGAAPDAAARAERLARLEQVRIVYGPGLPFDDRAAVSYALLAGAVARSGRRVRGRQVDLMIAATAHAHGAVVLTRNPADLEGVGDLLVVLGV